MRTYCIDRFMKPKKKICLVYYVSTKGRREGVSQMLTLKLLLYVPDIGQFWQYTVCYCQTGICIGTHNRNFRVGGSENVNSMQVLHYKQ